MPDAIVIRKGTIRFTLLFLKTKTGQDNVESGKPLMPPAADRTAILCQHNLEPNLDARRPSIRQLKTEKMEYEKIGEQGARAKVDVGRSERGLAHVTNDRDGSVGKWALEICFSLLGGCLGALFIFKGGQPKQRSSRFQSWSWAGPSLLDLQAYGAIR